MYTRTTRHNILSFSLLRSSLASVIGNRSGARRKKLRGFNCAAGLTTAAACMARPFFYFVILLLLSLVTESVLHHPPKPVISLPFKHPAFVSRRCHSLDASPSSFPSLLSLRCGSSKSVLSSKSVKGENGKTNDTKRKKKGKKSKKSNDESSAAMTTAPKRRSFLKSLRLFGVPSFLRSLLRSPKAVFSMMKAFWTSLLDPTYLSSTKSSSSDGVTSSTGRSNEGRSRKSKGGQGYGSGGKFRMPRGQSTSLSDLPKLSA